MSAPHTNTFVTSQGRAYSRFKRALETGGLASIRAALAKLCRD